jgi:hypothetical protein
VKQFAAEEIPGISSMVVSLLEPHGVPQSDVINEATSWLDNTNRRPIPETCDASDSPELV